MISAALNSVEVKARLAAMSARTRRNALKRAARKAAKPVVDELRSAWRGAARRDGKVSSAISAAQRYSVSSSSKRSTVTVRIGTDYGKGNQAKLWHILENGFKHYGRNATYTASPAAVRQAQKERDSFFDQATGGRKAVSRMARQRGGRENVRQLYRAVRAEWVSRHPDKEAAINSAWRSRNARRDAARKAGGRKVAGRRISRPVSERHVGSIAGQMKDILAAEVMAAARGKR